MSEELYKKLLIYNEWWATGRVREELAKPFKRFLFERLVERLDYPRILAILGPRRVGKTTIMYQLIKHLLSVKKVKSENILYVSLDEVEIKNVDELVTTYQEWVLGREIGKENVYFFLDEIQFLDKWSKQLKKFFDLKYGIQFIISGSSSVKIYKKTGESLVGRIDEHILMPLTFRDYLRFKNIELPETELTFDYKKLADVYKSMLKHKQKITTLLHQYLLEGGFPELYQYDSLLLKYEYIWKDVFEKVVYKDIPSIYNVRDPKLLKSLLEIAAKESCQKINYVSMSNSLGVKRETITNYITYLESAFLISLSKNYSKSMVKEQRSSKKIYLTDIVLKNALLRITNFTDTTELGKSIETVVYNHLKNLSYTDFNFDVSHWSERHKEVDIVLKMKNKIIPVEVKYKDKPSKKDLEGVMRFCERFDCKNGIVVTRDLFEKIEISNKKIFLIPVWLLLLIV